MNRLQEKLDLLCEKYAVASKPVLVDEKTVRIGGKDVPLLAHRAERRFIELRKVVTGGTLAGVSAMRTICLLPEGSDIGSALAREYDLCEYLLGREIASVMAFRNGAAVNVIASMKDGVVATIEISAMLAKGETPKEKHEIIAQHGIASDVAVDAQLRQDSLYVFGKENRAYTDVDFELYGLSVEEVAAVRAAFSVAEQGGDKERIEAGEKLKKLVGLTEKAVQSAERQVLA